MEPSDGFDGSEDLVCVLCADSEAVRLISEVEHSISLLPLMVGSTNIQAEIALAVQPLRSENAQLRRSATPSFHFFFLKVYFGAFCL